MHPQNAVEMSAHAKRLSACAQAERCLLKGVSCSMGRIKAGSEGRIVVDSSDLKIIVMQRKQVLCRYVIP